MHWGPLATGIAAYTSALLIQYFIRRRLKSSALREVLLYGAAICGLMLAVSFWSPGGTLDRFFGAPVATAFVGLAIAVLLFSLRDRSRLTYGVLEVVVATLALYALGIRPLGEDLLPAAVAFSGAVYVAVRGFTNIADSRKSAAGSPKTSSATPRMPTAAPL